MEYKVNFRTCDVKGETFTSVQSLINGSKDELVTILQWISSPNFHGHEKELVNAIQDKVKIIYRNLSTLYDFMPNKVLEEKIDRTITLSQHPIIEEVNNANNS